jgi:hypothetical protein
VKGPVNLLSPINRMHPDAQGLVSCWMALPGLDAGGTWVDLMRANPGTLVNMSQPASGFQGTQRVGGMRQIAVVGANSTYVNVGHPFGANGSGNKSISCWLQTMSASSGYLFTNIDAVPTGSKALYNASGTMTMTWNNSTPITSTTVVNDGRWHHCAFTFSTVSGGTGNIYVDGALIASGSIGSETVNTNAYRISGRWASSPSTGSGVVFTGALDDVRVYSRALSTSDVFRIYQQSLQGYPGFLNRIPDLSMLP